MSGINEAQKRNFVTQLIATVEKESETLKTHGYNSENKIQDLKVKKEKSDVTEANQQEALAKAKEATAESNRALEDAYGEAGKMLDVISGLLGKKHPVIVQMKKLRKK